MDDNNFTRDEAFPEKSVVPLTSIGGIPAAASPEMTLEPQLVAVYMQHRCQECEAVAGSEANVRSLFHSVHVPSISIWDYIRRIAKYSACSTECFITCLVLIDRYCEATQRPLSFRNVHRLVITATLASIKSRDDSYYLNAYYASIGGVSNSELNALELEFLRTIDWRTWIEPEVYYGYLNRLRHMYSQLLPPHG